MIELKKMSTCGAMSLSGILAIVAYLEPRGDTNIELLILRIVIFQKNQVYVYTHHKKFAGWCLGSAPDDEHWIVPG